MRRALTILLVAGLLAMAFPVVAQASFGLQGLDVTFTEADGSPALQAGSHPYAYTTTLAFNTRSEAGFPYVVPDGSPRDLTIAQVPGLAGDPTATPRCSVADFSQAPPACAAATQVGITEVTFNQPDETQTFPVYNLIPPRGVPAKLGFRVISTPVTIEVGLNPDPPFNLLARLTSISQALPFYAAKTTLWGNPPGARVPFLTAPRACRGPLPTLFEARSWEDPASLFSAQIETHDDAEPPAPRGFEGCERLAFSPTIGAQPTSKAATSPTGLDFSLDVKDEGLSNPDGLAASDIEKAVVTLPEGMSVNPSQAEGLEVCSQADLANETLSAEPGQGCPEASKIGSLEVETPLLEDQLLKGSLYVAEPYQNPFGSLLALYIVIKDPDLGILVRQPARVIPDPVTGQLTTVAEEMPQLPFSHFRLHFREGARSPLVTPPSCGAHTVNATLYPWAGGPPIESSSAFQVISGPDNSPCPTGGLPPFHPGLDAGTLNNAAGAFSPFNVKLTRTDSEQEITNFSIKLPPGIAGKLAGIPFCPDSAIAQATARTGPHGGQEELALPSCPAASYVGRTLAGAGVGPSLAYAPGRLYLAGPYHGAPLSIVSITAGVVGPFDIGTVVVRLAVKVNPETGEVFLDSTGSDPIPHIIKGIPVHLRDIRAYTDRPEFTYNPTNCEPTSTASTVLGSGLDFVSPADDNPFVATSRFQAADCASLGYKPKLSLRLRGSTKRGGNPALRAVLAPRPGDANSAAISVALPHSEFLEQGHIRTICTRVQFNAGAGNGAGCPAGSIYGHAKAWTPILAEPLEGPIFLRSSEHPLPDLVLALHGLIDFNAVGRIDSFNGGIRNSFDLVPDAPISKVVVDLQGGKKSLLANSRDLCKSVNRATAKFKGQNGKRYNARPILKVKCGKKHQGNKRHARAAR
jgi:hypothetical protein